MIEILTAAVSVNNIDACRMLELAREEDGALRFAQMCDGYAGMGGGNKLKMACWAAIVLDMFLHEHETF